MNLVREHIAVKLAAAALAFMATFAVVRAFDAEALSWASVVTRPS
jgi:hypothetical protein